MKKIMRTGMIALMAVMMFGGVAFAAEQAPVTREQVVSINDAFIPSNFDTASDAFVVINGLFPNGCYRFKAATVSHIGASLHEVRALATVSQGMCLMVLVPFSKEVQLGKLSAGEHAVRFMNGDGTFWEKSIQVEE